MRRNSLKLEIVSLFMEKTWKSHGLLLVIPLVPPPSFLLCLVSHAVSGSWLLEELPYFVIKPPKSKWVFDTLQGDQPNFSEATHTSNGRLRAQPH